MSAADVSIARVPAMANAHSHAFQRQLRAVAERPAPESFRSDDFWSWRESMYQLVETLEPDELREIAGRTYAEMARAGYGAVGEFHYLHHRPGGAAYEDPNLTAKLMAESARNHGLKVVLLPAAYRRAGWKDGDLPPNEAQRRFVDSDVATFLQRVDALREWAEGIDGVSVGVAAHSTRAVPARWLEEIAAYSERHQLVRHVHAGEQLRELEEIRAEHGCTPIELLQRSGFLGRRASVVHGIHVDEHDIALLAESSTTVVSCPTTEGNLGDGYLPALRYRDAGVPLAIGSDSQVRIDPFEEVRELETGSRREGQTRSGLLAAAGDLWELLATNGARSLGIDLSDCGWIDIDLEHPSLSGIQRGDLALALATCASAEAVTGHASRAETSLISETSG